MEFKKSLAMIKRAEKVIPRGVSSNFRYWGEDETPAVSRAQGAYLWDADGNRYIDYRLGFGPVILGHCVTPS
jgi:glutamate-1-semialdehyde 2,1-aminomutase